MLETRGSFAITIEIGKIGTLFCVLFEVDFMNLPENVGVHCGCTHMYSVILTVLKIHDKILNDLIRDILFSQ